MRVALKRSADTTVSGPSGVFGPAWSRVRPALAGALIRLQNARDHSWRSLAVFPSGLHRAINASDAEVVNLHWVGEETLSVSEIGAIRKPLVWTLHDMWPFCGAEHYAGDDAHARWRSGYERREAGSGALDIDRWVWRRKQKAWRRCQLVAPSRWLADCARASALMHDWPVTVVPNPLDTDVFRPVSAPQARAEWDLPPDMPVVLFGAAGGTRDARKGWDLLVAALEILASRGRPLACVVIGASEPLGSQRLRLPVRWLGHIDRDDRLAQAYAAADVTVVPSRQDNLPQTATEAQACGCPVVAFGTSGLPDTVEHGATGYLAEPFVPAELARGIEWVLAEPERKRRLQAQARERAVRLWSPAVVARRYVELYAEAIQASGGRADS